MSTVITDAVTVELETTETATETTATEKKAAGPTNRLNPRKCSRRINSCSRCGCAIEVGTVIVPWLDGPRFAVAGRYNWVHANCAPKGERPADAPKPVPPKFDDTVHPLFEKIVQLAKARKNIFLPGPAGCGKTFLAKQLAKHLDLQFGMISCSAGMSEGQVTGRLLPVGENGTFEYVISDFVRCYEQGGVFLLDEMDAADPNVLLVINDALDSDCMRIPNRPGNTVAMKHSDFICVAAANTFGRGADRMYCGRNQLDESTLSRFQIGTVPMDYDARIEARVCPDADLRKTLQQYRTNARNARIMRTISTRFMRDAYDMLCVGWSREEVIGKLFEGWTEEEARKVRG